MDFCALCCSKTHSKHGTVKTATRRLNLTLDTSFGHHVRVRQIRAVNLALFPFVASVLPICVAVLERHSRKTLLLYAITSK